MTEFVGYDVDIAARAVKICKDERLFIGGEGGAVASAPLAVARLNVKRLGACIRRMNSPMDGSISSYIFCALRNISFSSITGLGISPLTLTASS